MGKYFTIIFTDACELPFFVGYNRTNLATADKLQSG